MHETDDAVFASLANRVARELVVAHGLKILFQRVFHIDADQVGARGHDGLSILVADVEDVVHDLVGLGVDQTAFGGLVNEQLDFLVGVNLMLVLGIVTGQAHNGAGQVVEQPHDGERDAVEHMKDGRRVQRVRLGRVNGERLGDKLAHNHVKRGHDDVTNGDGDGGDGRIGNANGGQHRANEIRERGLAQPTQGKRSQSNAQLARRKIIINVVGDDLRRLRALAAFLQGHFNLRGAHAHHCEFSNDKKGVHQKERRNQ